MNIRPLCPELLEKARLELNEDPDRLPEDVQKIKDWIAKQPHLRARTDDQWIATFLRGCKFSLERTKDKLDLYYSIRTTAPELWRYKHNDPKFMEIYNSGTFLTLPKNSSTTSPRVTIFRPGSYDPSKYSISEVMSVANVVQQISLYEDDTLVVAGMVTLLDLSGVTASHFMQMTPTVMKKMVVIGQDATPIRMKGTHYVNTPAGFETIFNFIKGLLNEKNQSRLYVHNKNFEALYKYMPQEILPEEYGGNAGKISDIMDYWRNKIVEYSSWLDEDAGFGTDESKRPGKPKTAEDLFGVDGSFRQLQFD